MRYMEPYSTKMQEEIDELEKDFSISCAYRTAFIHGYQLAAYYWHMQGLREGWNNHVKAQHSLIEPLSETDKI